MNFRQILRSTFAPKNEWKNFRKNKYQTRNQDITIYLFEFGKYLILLLYLCEKQGLLEGKASKQTQPDENVFSVIKRSATWLVSGNMRFHNCYLISYEMTFIQQLIRVSATSADHRVLNFTKNLKPFKNKNTLPNKSLKKQPIEVLYKKSCS